MLIANVDLSAAHQRVKQEGRWGTSDPDDASIAVDAQATRRQCAPCFAAPIPGRRQLIGEFESRLVLLRRESSLAYGRRVRHRTLLFCAWAAKKRTGVRAPRRRGTGHGPPATGCGESTAVGIRTRHEARVRLRIFKTWPTGIFVSSHEVTFLYDWLRSMLGLDPSTMG